MAAMSVLGAPKVAAFSTSDKLASGRSVTFSNGGRPSMAFVSAKSVRPFTIRASKDLPDSESSTGGISEKAKELAEKAAAVFDGVKEDVEGKLKDGGRDLKSKTGDVVYGAQRNAEGVGADAKEKANESQTKFTKGQ